MSQKEQLLAILATVLTALAPVGWALVRLLRVYIAKVTGDLEDAQAKRAVQTAKELRARTKQSGEWAEKEAIAEFKKRVPKATDESAKAAVLAAVGEIPDVGASKEPK